MSGKVPDRTGRSARKKRSYSRMVRRQASKASRAERERQVLERKFYGAES